jgi:polysaccharide export outer membrane protein
MRKNSINPWLAGLLVCSSMVFGFQADYKVGKLDVVSIEVAGDPDFKRDVPVSDKGTIKYGVLGELKVEGMSVSEITEFIREELQKRKLFTDPSVSVSVKEYRSQSVTILGEVGKMGRYFLKGPEKLLDVLAEAGGPTADAGDVVITHAAENAEGRDAKDIIIRASELLRDTTPLQSGDVILIKRREVSQVYVSGEVVSAKAVAYTEGMTVSQAVLMAGGLSKFGSKSKITIRHKGSDKLIRVNLADIEKGKAKDEPLMPNDQIIVGRRVF